MKTHSIQLVMVTTMGIAKGEHASIVNQSITLDDLFVERWAKAVNLSLFFGLSSQSMKQAISTPEMAYFVTWNGLFSIVRSKCFFARRHRRDALHSKECPMLKTPFQNRKCWILRGWANAKQALRSNSFDFFSQLFGTFAIYYYLCHCSLTEVQPKRGRAKLAWAIQKAEGLAVIGKSTNGWDSGMGTYI